MTAQLTVLSLGAGVQSTTMALMAAHGEITPMPDCAIFADTQGEPQAVYEHLRWLMSPNVLPFPVHVVTAGSLTAEMLAAGNGDAGGYGRVPFFVKNPDGSRGMVRRQCTQDYKLEPIRKKTRELIGLKPRQRAPRGIVVERWIGISTDEAARAKQPRDEEGYVKHRFPLIELGMNRWDCQRWTDRHGYPRSPKSACVFCPFHSDAQWRSIRDDDPEGWALSVEIDRVMRRGPARKELGGDWFLHSSLKPLDQVDLSTAEDRGQLNMFNNECEGMCGV